MIPGINLGEVVEYICKDDTENPTVWKLGVLPSRVIGQISTLAPGAEVETAYKLLQVSIKGWSNFDVEFSTKKETLFGREMDAIPLEVLERVPLKTITELSKKVLEINGLTEAETKN